MVNRKHFRFCKDWFVFPLAIMWENGLCEYIPHANRITIHFLWWHWGWTFIKEKKDGTTKD